METLKWFLIGALTPLAVWTIAYFAALGWYKGRPNQTIQVNLNSGKPDSKE